MTNPYINFCGWITDVEMDTNSKAVIFAIKIVDKILVSFEKVYDSIKRSNK